MQLRLISVMCFCQLLDENEKDTVRMKVLIRPVSFSFVILYVYNCQYNSQCRGGAVYTTALNKATGHSTSIGQIRLALAVKIKPIFK